MSPYLATGQAKRDLSARDLVFLKSEHDDSGVDYLLASDWQSPSDVRALVLPNLNDASRGSYDRRFSAPLARNDARRQQKSILSDVPVGDYRDDHQAGIGTGNRLGALVTGDSAVETPYTSAGTGQRRAKEFQDLALMDVLNEWKFELE